MTSPAVLNAPRHRRRLETIRLKNDHLRLDLSPEFGCHWTRLRVSIKGEWTDFLKPVPSGDALLDGPGGHGSYLLAPWSNRIPGGMFRFGGRPYEVQPNFRDGSAIHGDVRQRPWTRTETTPLSFEATLTTSDFDDFNYPFALRFRHAITLRGDRLEIRLDTENIDSVRAPVGVGFHPYFLRHPSWRDEDVFVNLAAERVYPLEKCLPTAPAIDVSGDKDLRSLKPLGCRELDDLYTGLTDNKIRLIYPGSRVELRLELDENFSHVIVHAPRNGNGAPSSFVAVEPLTHVTNGFNLQEDGWSDTGVRVLEPGETWSTRWSLSVGDI